MPDPHDGEEKRGRHEDGARHAPLAEGVDHEELEPREIGAEEDADEGDEQAEERPTLALEQRRQQQPRVAGEPEHSNRYTQYLGVAARLDRFAASSARQADGRYSP